MARTKVEVTCLLVISLLGLSVLLAESRLVRAVPVEHPPTLDGRVDEPEWNQAPPATDFVQQRPIEGRPATEKTEVRFLYTKQALYIGIVCFDSEPDKVLDTQSRRDGDLTDSDSVLIILDTYRDRQNGFLFGTNPSGIQYDAQILTEGVSGGQVTSSGVGGSATGGSQRGNVSAVNVNWDVTWKVQSRRTERGWEAEIEIPLKSLRFKEAEGPQAWGLNIMRNVRRKNEQSFWAPVPQAYNIYRVSMAGDLEGLEIHPPRNLKAIPYILGGPQKDYSISKTDFRNEAGLDVKYGLTSTMTLDVTVNTDFAQVEVDDEQINLTRFDLFFPEKRAFFLENAGTFAFGTPREMDLFFSRRIGIEGGHEIPIRGGARLTGKMDRFNLGILSIQTGEESGVASGQNFFVGRVRREFHRRSSAGFIFTNRENLGQAVGHTEYNRSWGLDLQLALHDYWIVSSYLAKTYSPDRSGDDYAGNVYVGYKSSLWRVEGNYSEIQDNFNPEIGFVPRRGFRKPEFKVFFTPSPESGPVRQWNPHWTIRRYYGFDGKLETERRHHDFEIFLRDGGSLGITYNRDHEFLRAPFNPHPGVTIPAGTYDANEFDFSFSSNPSARIFGGVNLTLGGYYGGDIKSYNFELGLRTGPKFVTTFGLVNTGVDADWGHFNTNLGRLKLDYSFTPTRFIQAFLQYNSRFNQFSANIRLGLIDAAGTGLYVVYNERYDTPGERFDPLNRALFIKYTYLFDF
ncbi:MAG: carbohydrate binding family 9 domain-containing protein [Acidobacteria bacterium]|nr:carbohydrate binding family 9 domain-containing protein [Acidobacteriota bacterium]